MRPLARSNQKTIYNLLFRASGAALLQLAQDPRFIGAHLGMVGVLHTWTRQLLYHPHVHYIVTGGGLTDDGRWVASPQDFLVPVKALSRIFRAKFRDALKKTELFSASEDACLAQRLGGPFRTRRQWPASLPVSCSLHLSRRYQQQPPTQLGKRAGYFRL